MNNEQNILSAAVPITLDGRELAIRFRAFAFITYAETFDRDLLQDVAGMAQSLKDVGDGARAGAIGKGFGEACAKLRDVLWAGLVDLQPKITRDEIARMFSVADFTTIVPALMKAIQATLPEDARPMIAVQTGRDSARANGQDSGLSIGIEAASLLPSSVA
jgi:hypothetical protein